MKSLALAILFSSSNLLANNVQVKDCEFYIEDISANYVGINKTFAGNVAIRISDEVLAKGVAEVGVYKETFYFSRFGQKISNGWQIRRGSSAADAQGLYHVNPSIVGFYYPQSDTTVVNAPSDVGVFYVRDNQGTTYWLNPTAEVADSDIVELSNDGKNLHFAFNGIFSQAALDGEFLTDLNPNNCK
ncbi:MAG: hypothetical protein HRU19_00810 [Pseudobacteriovorax sp.]|nr:hypothetical protein [Gammaproteobacteria bacterium]NRA62987.1 hypothetical protein [Pseudobacteriovorax sp.]